jgi:hypothetical protein
MITHSIVMLVMPLGSYLLAVMSQLPPDAPLSVFMQA